MNDHNLAFDELAGRIDAIGQALLRVVAELELARRIDGQRVSQAWRRVRAVRPTMDRQLATSAQVLEQMAAMLDDARQARSTAVSTR